MPHLHSALVARAFRYASPPVGPWLWQEVRLSLPAPVLRLEPMLRESQGQLVTIPFSVHGRTFLAFWMAFGRPTLNPMLWTNAEFSSRRCTCVTPCAGEQFAPGHAGNTSRLTRSGHTQTSIAAATEVQAVWDNFQVVLPSFEALFAWNCGRLRGEDGP